MKTILSTTAAFLMAGAVSGYVYEAIRIRQTPDPTPALSDFTFEIIYAMVFGVFGCLLGLIVGTALYWFKRRSNQQKAITDCRRRGRAF